MKAADVTLPDEFRELEPWVSQWAHDSCDERVRARGLANMHEIEAFYSAAAPRAESALDSLKGIALGDLTASQSRLLKLMLGLAHVSIAVEVQKSHRIRG